MVYCGKPSRACGRCRLRRLKCDEGTPLCSACLRARVESCEYRDPLNLRFRDQSEKVVRKAQQQKAKRTSAALPTSTPIKASNPTLSSPHQGLACPSGQLARGYMYTNYMAKGHYGSYLPCLVALAEASPDSALPAAITAVGLAALSNIHQCPQVMLEARKECTTAISLTNSALNDPVGFKRDDVLAAVLMLGMFEVMTCSSDASSIGRWMGHVDGAARIIEMRGEGQLDGAEGLELFTHLRTQICTAGILREHYSSPMIAQYTEKAKHCRSPQSRIVDDLCISVLRLNDFCAAMKDRTFTQPSDIIRAALKLDGDLVAALLDTPLTSSYRIVKVSDVTCEESPERTVWGDAYHIYSSIAASSMWNNYRSARILLREIIIDTLQHMRSAKDGDDNRHHALTHESRQIALQLVDDILASVPFHLGVTLPCETPSSPTDQPQLSVGAVGSGGMTLLWPLLSAANSGFASLEQRKWIIACLDKIGRGMGINQARAMAQLLRDKIKSRAWLTEDDREEFGGYGPAP